MSLWALDVLVHLGLAERLFADDQLVSGVGFLGLLLVDAQVALAIALAAWLGGEGFARITRRPAAAESLALLVAGLVSVAVRVASSSGAALGAGLVVWGVVRAIAVRRSDAALGLSETLGLSMGSLLLVSGSLRALHYVSDGQRTEAAVLLGVALLALVYLAWAARVRPPAWTRPVAWLPLAAAIGLAGLLSFGAFDVDPPAPTRASSQSRERPDIVLIVLDTVRADHLRLYGYERNTMPRLEEWADRALVVENAISAGGWTSPSHASIFSGRNVSGHGVHYLPRITAGGRFWSRPVEGVGWLPERLAERGYACFAVTANELALPEEIRGFQRVIAPRFVDWGGTVAGSIDRRLPWSLSLSERLRWRMPYVDGAEMVQIAKHAVPQDAAPVFLFVNLMDAHSPYNPPVPVLDQLGFRHPRIFGRYSTPFEITSQWERLPEGKREYLVDLYDADLHWLDMNLAQLLHWVDARFGEDAVVVVTSDHGEMLGEGGIVGHDQGLAQELLHVPLLVRAPGIDPGRLSEPVGVRNLYRFLASAAEGAGADAGQLRDAGEGIISERYPREASGKAGRARVSLVDDGIQVVGPSAEGLETEPLDGRAAAPDADRVARMGEQVDLYWERERDRRELDPAGQNRLSRDRIERLRALGYVD